MNEECIKIAGELTAQYTRQIIGDTTSNLAVDSAMKFYKQVYEATKKCENQEALKVAGSITKELIENMSVPDGERAGEEVSGYLVRVYTTIKKSEDWTPNVGTI